MTDRQMLDRIADAAPPPSARLAEDVIDRGRQRRRRRWAVLSSCAAVIVIAGVAVTVSAGSGPEHHSAGSGLSPTPAHHVSGGPSPTRPAATLGRVYAAAIRYEATVVRGSSTGVAAIDIVDRYCPSATAGPASSCSAARIGAVARRNIVAALTGSVADRVRFVSYTGRTRVGSQHAIVVTLAGASVHGMRATAGVQVQCGFDCAGGTRLQLRLRGGHWAVVAVSGKGWID